MSQQSVNFPKAVLASEGNPMIRPNRALAVPLTRTCLMTAAGLLLAVLAAPQVLAADNAAQSRVSLIRGGSEVQVIAKMSGGSVRMEHHSKRLSAVQLLPGQGIVALAGGAVHDDTDDDGVLDGGESIDYSYTVVNLGDSALSSLSLVDDIGAVVCPQSTLAIAAHMICSRSYQITPADELAGAVINEVEVVGQDAGALAVQAADLLITQNLAGAAGLRVFKSPRVITDVDASATVTQSDLLRYTFLLKNSGAETLSALNLTEPDPSRIDTAITCQATSLDGLAFSGNGSGSLVAGDSILCSADYTVRDSDAALGQVLNLVEARGTAPVAGSLFASGASAVVAAATPIPMIGVSKILSELSGSGPYLVRFTMEVRNYGPMALTDVQVTEDLRDTFPLPVSFTVQAVDVTGSALANAGFDGESDINLLDASQSNLAVDGVIAIEMLLEVDPQGLFGPFLNTVTASGRDVNDVVVADESVSGADPDPDGDGTPDEGSPTPIVFPPRAPVLVPPAVIPSASGWSLMLLVLVMLGAAVWRGRAS